MFKLLIIIVTFWAIFVNAHASTLNSQRELKAGELVIYRFDIFKVVDKSDEQTYQIRNLNSVSNAKREELAIMDGCVDEICVKDITFDTGYLRYVSIEGITYHDDYLVKASEGWKGYYQPFKNNIAVTSGCHASNQRKFCVGDKVKDFMNNLMTIIAIQQDFKFVLKSNDGWNTYRTNVDVDTLSVGE